MGLMPRDSKRQKTGRQAVRIAAAWLEEHGLIWRDGDGDADFGIDGEIELAGSELTGLLVKVQVKGTARASFTKAGVYKVDVAPTQINYWAAIQLPVVALLVDTTTRRLYWTSPKPVFGESEAKLIFTSGQCLNDDLTNFRQALYQLARWPASTAVLDHVEYFVTALRGLLENGVGERDFGFAVDDSELGLIELIYDHLLRLRGVLGLTKPPVVPLPSWLDRSQYVSEITGLNSECELLDTVAGELLAYLKPIYLDTLRRVGEIAQHDSAIDSHRRLAGYAASGRLDEDQLATLLDPWQSPADGFSVRYSRQQLDHRSREAQMRFDTLLNLLKISRINVRDLADRRARAS
jgi:Domain of unknown function (DUF4365)